MIQFTPARWQRRANVQRSVVRGQPLDPGASRGGAHHIPENLGDLQLIDARRVVVEQRERGEQVRAAEPGELLQLGVEPRPHFDASAIERRLIESFLAHELDDGIDGGEELVGRRVASWKNCAIHSIGPL